MSSLWINPPPLTLVHLAQILLPDCPPSHSNPLCVALTLLGHMQNVKDPRLRRGLVLHAQYIALLWVLQAGDLRPGSDGCGCWERWK
jgi:hypothetical protein